MPVFLLNLLNRWFEISMEKPLVTIAISFYNVEKFLPYAIMSVINQSYNNWELFLIDDGSSDQSVMVAKEFVNKDKRIKLISDGKNKGLAARLNESVEMANGDFYARMDADDIMVINRIDEQVSFLSEHPDVDVVGSSAMVIDINNNIINSMDYTGVYDTFIHPTIMTRPQWLKRNRYNDNLKMSEDYELWLRTQGTNTFFNLSQPLLFYRIYNDESYQKKLRAFKTLTPIYSNYKSYGKSFTWFLKSFLISFFKIIIYWICFHFKCMKSLNKKRWNRKLQSELLLLSDDLMRAIS